MPLTIVQTDVTRFRVSRRISAIGPDDVGISVSVQIGKGDVSGRPPRIAKRSLYVEILFAIV